MKSALFAIFVILLSVAYVKSDMSQLTDEEKAIYAQIGTKISELKTNIDAKADDSKLIASAEAVTSIMKANVQKAPAEYQAEITANIKGFDAKIDAMKVTGKFDQSILQSFLKAMQ